MNYDVIVLGSGPAGLAAAVAACGRNKRVLVVGNRWEDSPLAKAEQVDNYLGMPGVTGREMLERFHSHAVNMGAEMVTGKVIALMEWDGYMLTVGDQVYQGRALVLAPGVVRQAKFPGEQEYLGRGVSYCATCDGMLYRGKEVVVVGRSKDAPHEANYLSGIGCKVTYVTSKTPEDLNGEITVVNASRIRVEGEGTGPGVFADDVNIGSVGNESGQRAGENTFCAVCKADLSSFHWRIIVPVTNLQRISAHCCNVRPKKKSCKVNRVTAAENERAAGPFSFPHPASAISAEPIINICHKDFSEFAVSNEPFLHLRERIEPENQAHNRLCVILFQRCGQAIQLFFADSCRFFQKNLFSGFCGKNCFFRMQIVRSANGNHIHATVVEDFIKRTGESYVAEPEFLNFCLCALFPSAAETDQFAIGVFEICGDMTACNPAAAPDGTTIFSLIHKKSFR